MLMQITDTYDVMVNVVLLGKFYQSTRHRIWQESTNAVKLHAATEIPLASFLLG